MSTKMIQDPEEEVVQYPIAYTAVALGTGMALGFLMIYFLLASPLIRGFVGFVDSEQLFIKNLSEKYPGNLKPCVKCH